MSWFRLLSTPDDWWQRGLMFCFYNMGKTFAYKQHDCGKELQTLTSSCNLLGSWFFSRFAKSFIVNLSYFEIFNNKYHTKRPQKHFFTKQVSPILKQSSYSYTVLHLFMQGKWRPCCPAPPCPMTLDSKARSRMHDGVHHSTHGYTKSYPLRHKVFHRI